MTSFRLHLLFPLFLAAPLAAGAQTADAGRYRTTGALEKSDNVPNFIRLVGGFGMVTSKIVDYNRVSNHSTSGTVALDYQHVWESGMGFGINLMHTKLYATDNLEHYIGASFVAAYTSTNGWRWDASFGMGYAANDFEMPGSTSGLGMLSTAGVTYKLSPHWGISATLRSSVSRFKQPEGWEGGYGITHFDLGVGLSYGF